MCARSRPPLSGTAPAPAGATRLEPEAATVHPQEVRTLVGALEAGWRGACDQQGRFGASGERFGALSPWPPTSLPRWRSDSPRSDEVNPWYDGLGVIDDAVADALRGLRGCLQGLSFHLVGRIRDEAEAGRKAAGRKPGPGPARTQPSGGAAECLDEVLIALSV